MAYANPFTITVPAGTLKTAPVSAAWAMEGDILDEIQFVIPFGHNGFTGIHVLWSNTVILPWGQGTWLVSSNEYGRFPIGLTITNANLIVEAYNTGQYQHSFFFRGITRDSGSTTQAAQSILQPDRTLEIPAASTDPLSSDVLLAGMSLSDLGMGQVTA